MAAPEFPVSLDPAADYDVLGRKQPHRLGFMQFARRFPGYAAQFGGRVPPNFYIQVEPGVIDISCPCGHTPRCELMVPTPCECERIFVYTGAVVRVARAARS